MERTLSGLPERGADGEEWLVLGTDIRHVLDPPNEFPKEDIVEMD
jgi:hypothetical protein